VELHNVMKCFGKVEADKDMSLRVEGRELVVLLGPGRKLLIQSEKGYNILKIILFKCCYV